MYSVEETSESLLTSSIVRIIVSTNLWETTVCEKTMDTKTIQDIVKKSANFGTTEIPTSSHSEATQAIIAICKASPKKSFSAKDMNEIIADKTKGRKFYSDKMWQLVQQGILEKTKTKQGVEVRGLYKYPEKSEEAQV